MHYLFLRGISKAATKNTDMWLNLFTKIVGKNDTGEMVCFGEPYYKKVSENFVIKTMPSIDNYQSDPDIIFVRGRFKEWINFLTKHKSVKKIYYGAGNNGSNPNTTIYYDIILSDCQNQLDAIIKTHPKSKCVAWAKPAHEIFTPPKIYTNEYDICFIGNGKRPHKGHLFVKETCPKDIKILHLGTQSEVDEMPNVTQILSEHNEMPKWIGKCKIGIVPYSSKDSCPRVIPEMLACGIPIVAFNTVNFWHNLYKDVIVTDTKNFWNTVKNTSIDNKQISDRYNNEISVLKVADFLRKLCME